MHALKEAAKKEEGKEQSNTYGYSLFKSDVKIKPSTKTRHEGYVRLPSSELWCDREGFPSCPSNASKSTQIDQGRKHGIGLGRTLVWSSRAVAPFPKNVAELVRRSPWAPQYIIKKGLLCPASCLFSFLLEGTFIQQNPFCSELELKKVLSQLYL